MTQVPKDTGAGRAAPQLATPMAAHTHAHMHAHADARTDAVRRRIVDTALALRDSSNTMTAVEYMHRHDIGAGVMTRVLLEPGRRRVG